VYFSTVDALVIVIWVDCCCLCNDHANTLNHKQQA